MKTRLSLIFGLLLALEFNLGSQAQASSYCSSFIKNLESSFSEGIEHIEQSRHHLAYDSFGETLMRIKAESKYLSDCRELEKEQLNKLKRESTRTLTALHGQIQ